MTRHALLCFRGTGGEWGLDYTSRLAQACSALVEEIDVDAPATMGAAPVGAATDPLAPSGFECVHAMVEWAVRWVRNNPTRTFGIAAYSLGAIGAVVFAREFMPGGRLEKYRSNFLFGVTIGNPARTRGHTFYLGEDPGGEGISDIRLPDGMFGWEWADLVQTGDLYGNVLGNPLVVKVCRDAYAIVMTQQLHDPLRLIFDMLPLLLQIVADSVNWPLSIPRTVTSAVLGLFASLLPMLPVSNDKTAAAVAAASQGIGFALAQPPTAPHITYEFAEVWPGMTYFDLAVQHVNDWAARTPARD
ncbi:hypothetical protein [Mycobacteroides abscessus]|uniref:hypothetical protein n=1 Tax=Mycobacteroides abscessus TaxID=36809 RepID=UPI0009279ABC|nr:hypothetical protein [Mycobacteroides abscessus]MBE5440212.1 hypothetical protein [Mycobacteroides abscessus]SID45424.1 Uncharacterised protein [Mycobacteroides abscessus subsp. abscessus]SIG28402.1 Uncharacterised protein [Mycobacteroides abscessus subsp. abscessus]SIJ94978.1 Uncharacterised protein [Mycobacteroides abscessus subsp. abscessus]SKU08292.1 Uncharacterised protein [Mycobacteroides abscessus subsp. abscessus]